MAESFFGALKNEWLNRMVFATRGKARRAVVQYIEGFYNRRRLHSANGYRTPFEVYNEYLDRLAALADRIAGAPPGRRARCAGPGCDRDLPAAAETGRPRLYCGAACRQRARRRIRTRQSSTP